MSSTNRGSERHKDDYYVTPPAMIEEFLDAWERDDFGGRSFSLDHTTATLDPCAGGDAGKPMSYPLALARQGVSRGCIHTMDKRTDSRAQTITDYLTTELHYRPSLIIANPPFVHAQEFVEKALRDVDEGGRVVMLLRLSFFGSQKRKPFWEGHMPEIAYVHSKRWSFTGGGTDSAEYMHAIWSPIYQPKFTHLRTI